MSLRDLRDYPGLLPGLVVSLLVGLAVSAPLARVLRTSRWLAVFLVVAFGFVLSATLTPSADAIRFGAEGSGVCDLTRLTIAPLRELTRLSDASTNVILLVPLGVALGLLPASRTKVGLVVASFALPIVVEWVQLVAVQLGRQCQSADAIDNIVGLTAGIAVGAVAHLVIARGRSETT